MKDATNAVIPQSELKHVLLSDIQADPNQPRKYFDEEEMQELTDSVREKGVQTPITIRLNPGKGAKYMIITGERRLRAATAVQVAFKERNTIPCSIITIPEEEVLQLQIIENLQRADVHPMEEAVSFKSLLENKARKMTIEEVAARVGKTVYFVRQRIKLNSLSKDWQTIFFKGLISVTDALEICQLGPDQQVTLYKAKVHPSNIKAGHEIELQERDLQKLRCSFKAANFKLDDETLDPKMGACTKCPFNTAVGALFPEDEKDARCNNAACFNGKNAAAFDIKIKKVIDDPEMILIGKHCYTNEDRQLYDKLKKDGHKIYDVSYGGDAVESDSYEYKGMKGLPVKGFHVVGNDKGRVVNVKIKRSQGAAAQLKQKQKAGGEISKADIDAEIKRMQDREKRSKELDLNKIHQATIKEVDKSKAAIMKMPYQGAVDRGLMIFLLIEKAGSYHSSEKIKKITGIDVSRGFKRGYNTDYFTKLSKIKDDQLAQIIRTLVFEHYLSPNLQNDVSLDDTCIRLIAQYAGVDIKSIESEQKAVANKRNERMNARIASLRGKKKETVKKSPAKKKK